MPNLQTRSRVIADCKCGSFSAGTIRISGPAVLAVLFWSLEKRGGKIAATVLPEACFENRTTWKDISEAILEQAVFC